MLGTKNLASNFVIVNYSIFVSVQLCGLRTGTGGRDLWVWWWTFGFHKMRNFLTSWKQVSFSRRLCSIEWVSKYIYMVGWSPDVAYIPYIHKCVRKKVVCGTSHTYTNIQTYSVKYKHFAKTQLWVILTHKRFVFWVKACALKFCACSNISWTG